MCIYAAYSPVGIACGACHTVVWSVNAEYKDPKDIPVVVPELAPKVHETAPVQPPTPQPSPQPSPIPSPIPSPVVVVEKAVFDGTTLTMYFNPPHDAYIVFLHL